MRGNGTESTDANSRGNIRALQSEPRLGLLAAAVLLALAPGANGQTSVNFDSFVDGTSVNTQVPGLTFSNAVVSVTGFSLNELDFPAHSGTNVAYDAGGPIAIAFNTAVNSFSGYFTHAVTLQITAYDANGNQLTSTASPSTNNTLVSGNTKPNENLSVTSGTGIAKVVISGSPTGASFAMDDLTTTVTPPSGGGGGGGGGGAPPPSGSSITASPTSVTLSAVVGGGSASGTVTLSYQTYTQGAPTFSTNSTVNEGLGWLSVSPASGTMTQASYAGFLYTYAATITISVNSTGIAAGSSYTGNVNFSAGGGLASIPVTMNVSAQAAKFAVVPQSLTFNYQQGNATTPSPQSLSVFSTPSSAGFSASVTSSSSWLSVGTGSTTPESVGVSVIVNSLAPGTYTGTVTISSGTSVNIPVPVSITVTKASAPVLSASPTLQSFSLTQGSKPANGLVTVSNTGGGTLQFTASATSDQGWLKLSGAGSGSATSSSPASVALTITPATLTPGLYNGSILVSDSNSSAQATIKVVLTITNPEPQIQISNTGLTLTGVAGGAPPQAQTFSIVNSGAGSLNWSAQTSTISGARWLTATPASGSLAGGQSGTAITVSGNTTGLAAGVYYGSVNVVSPNAVNSPQTISVVLNLLASAPSPAVTVSAGSVVLTGASTSTPQQKVGLFNLSPSAINYTASTFTQNGAGWLSVTPASGSVSSGSGSLQIGANLSGLTGLQTGSVTLSFGDGSSAAIQVTALAIGTSIANVRAGNRAGSSLNLRPLANVTSCPGGKASFLTPTFQQPINQSSVQAAAAATVQVEVVDDCGNPVTAAGGGAVQVTFSNNDPGINLNDLGSGIWEGTWTPANASAQVGLQITATENGLTLNPSINIPTGVQLGVTAVSASSPAEPTGIANAASAGQATPQVVAPGSYVAIYGTGLAASGSPSATTLPLPTTLNGAQLFLGGLPMPLLYASSGQINALIPQAIAPNATYPLVAVRGTTQSVPVALTVAELQPGDYTVDTSGSGAGIVTNALTGQLITPSNPAHASDYLVVYCTGLGALTGPNGEAEPGDGVAAPSNLVYQTTAKVTATIGGVSTTVLFAGLTPTFAALYQVNLQVPAGVTPGNAVPLVITATDPNTGATAQSNSVTIVVQ